MFYSEVTTVSRDATLLREKGSFLPCEWLELKDFKTLRLEGVKNVFVWQ